MKRIVVTSSSIKVDIGTCQKCLRCNESIFCFDYTEEVLYRDAVNSDSSVTVTDAEMLMDTAINGTYTNFGYENHTSSDSVVIW